MYDLYMPLPLRALTQMNLAYQPRSVFNFMCFFKDKGGEPPTQFSKRMGGMTGPQFLEGLLGGGDFFSGGGCNFYIN